MSTDVRQEDFFARVPKTIVYHPELTGNDVRVYATLSERAGSKRATWPSVRRIAEDIGMSPTTVQKSLDKLEELGVVEVERTDGRVNRYYLPVVLTVSETGTATVSDSDTAPDGVCQELEQTVSETGTELDPGTRNTSPNGEVHALFEAFFEFWTGRKYHPDRPIPKSQRARLNAAVKEASSAGIDPDDVQVRGSRYRREWPKLEATPQALLSNWARFDEPPEPEVFDPDACVHPRVSVIDGAEWCGVCRRELDRVV